MKTGIVKTNRSTKQGQRTAVFLKPEDRFSDHIRIEERSIALHRAIADRIRKNPRLMEKAGENLQKYLEHIIRAAGSITKDDEIILRERISMLRVKKSIKDRILKRIGK